MLYEIIIVRPNIIGLMSYANEEKMSIYIQRRQDRVGTRRTPPSGH